jgi:hypothetical protein
MEKGGHERAMSVWLERDVSYLSHLLSFQRSTLTFKKGIK